ncbi:carboxypeptidase-like regulatory domain-containing protein [Dyadobacter sp. LHD-138]|uniref:carboxypeptidase-like regulatory domain-containing protein n=1 Tax=Dyadobacter sp. LHD-138 TaxID=3071413 RepID=UPI0027DEAE80|nr:carboxypeptidase-like regulatory domain-containing protein [Dyadobacter sp. LHD-138]MDQ6477422.1 carboxypeptidase-like regulatory domain-containing protein [Dyadobacter sp. LHD-138]
MLGLLGRVPKIGFLLLFVSLNAYAQTRHIAGRILDVQQQAIPFASIQIEGENNGTVTNEQGYFNLVIRNLENRILVVSSLGYKTNKHKIDIDKQGLIVILEADATQLNEVFIFPDSSLKVLLAKAYRKINDNYPQNSIELIGFYRSYHKSTKDNRYLDFTESSLRIQQSGYQNSKEDAQVEVLKVRNLRFPQRDSIDNVRYYGGAFMVNWNDPVKMREAFLNPAYFNKRFIYQLESISKYNMGKDSVYVIQFKSNDTRETKEGKIWIDKKTLAYQKIEWKDNDPKNPNPLIPIRRITRNYLTLYQHQDAVNVVKYTSVSGKNYNGKTKQESNYVLEFVTTACDLIKNRKQIPLEKRLKYGELFAELESTNDMHFWDEYTTIEMDSALKMARIRMSRDETAKASYKEIKSRRDLKVRIYNLTKRITIGYALNGAFFKSIDKERVWLDYMDQMNGGARAISRPAVISGSTISIGYELNPYKQLRMDFTDGLFNSNLYKVTSIKFYQYYLVKREGNPLFVTASIGFSIGKAGLYLGELSSEKDIVMNGKNLGKNSKVFLGDRDINGQIGLGLEYRKKRLSYFGELSYAQNIHQKDILLLRMKRNFLFTRTVVTDYPSSEILITPENVYRGVSPMSMAFGIRMRL